MPHSRKSSAAGASKPKPALKAKVDKPEPDTVASFEAMLQLVPTGKRYELRLFITGTTPRSTQAIANIRSLCEEHLPGRYDLEVVDIYQQPAAASAEQIIAAPTLVKKSPSPSRRLVGDLSDRNKVLIGLNLAPSGDKAPVGTKWIKV